MKELTSKQEAVYKQYPTYKQFMDAQQPQQMLINLSDIHEIEEVISIDRLSLEEMNEIYGTKEFSPGVNYMGEWLKFFNQFSNINNRLPLHIIEWVAIQVYFKYCHFYFADLKVLFEKILEERYGKFYGSVDTVRILSAFLQYDCDRKRILDKEKERREIQYITWSNKRITELKEIVFNEVALAHPEWDHNEKYEYMERESKRRLSEEAKKLFSK